MTPRNMFLVAMLAATVSGCAGKIDYTPPAESTSTNTKQISRQRDVVWNELVPALSKNFFVINTIDKSSGLINISYSGDPEKYADCGMVHSYVKNARGERNYDFNGATASEQYETFVNNNLLNHNRRVALDGRMNIILTADGPGKTVMTVNARYVLSITDTVNDVEGHVANFSNTISFNTGGIGHGQTISCRPTGDFEQAVLDLVH